MPADNPNHSNHSKIDSRITSFFPVVTSIPCAAIHRKTVT